MRRLFLILMGITMATSASIAQSVDEKAVEVAVEFLRLAMVSGNREDLEKIAHDKLSYGHSSGTVEDKKQFVENIASGSSDFLSIELTDQTIILSGNTALVRHKLYAKTNDKGKPPGEVRLIILLVFQKENKEWKLLARQAARMPS